jgi:protein-disulfide isomerase
MSKQFWGILAVIVLIFVGIAVFSGHKNNNSSNATGSSGKPTQHIEGLGKSGVTLVEYGDYECPFCEEYSPIVKQVQQEFNDQIFFQFRNFPLTSVHPNAFAGARAAEAAALQGQFWEMHDALYESSNWQVWSTSSDPTPYFNQYAQQLGLNVAQFKRDFSGEKVNNEINADMAVGTNLNIQGTPTFFLDGKQVQVGATVGAFETVIKKEITKKTAASSSTSKSTTTTSSTPTKTD